MWIVPKDFNTKQGHFPIEKDQNAWEFSESISSWFMIFSQVCSLLLPVLLSQLKWLWMRTSLYFGPHLLSLCGELQWICYGRFINRLRFDIYLTSNCICKRNLNACPYWMLPERNLSSLAVKYVFWEDYCSVFCFLSMLFIVMCILAVTKWKGFFPIEIGGSTWRFNFCHAWLAGQRWSSH